MPHTLPSTESYKNPTALTTEVKSSMPIIPAPGNVQTSFSFCSLFAFKLRIHSIRDSQKNTDK